jgi:hypothetical protein
MRVPTRHPRLSAIACRIYSLTICVYPTEFRRAFGHELVVTFRNRVEDVLDAGGILEWLAFAGHIAIDCIRTCSTLSTDLRACRSASLLGLSDDARSLSGFDCRMAGVSRVLVTAGVVLSAGAWYMLVVSSPRW